MAHLDLNSLVARDGNEFDCATDRATDYYGLGVRLGIYFAWVASYIANTILPSEFGPASDTSTIFLLTLLIAMANDSMTKGLTELDGLILMHLCGGTVFGIISMWGYRTRMYFDEGPRAVRKFGGFGTHVRLIVSLGVSVFGTWFWFRGVNGSLKKLGPNDGFDPANPEECSVLYTFFFAKVRAAGGIRIYYIIVSLTCTAWFATMFLVSSLAGLASLDKIRGLAGFNRWTSLNRAKYATGFTHKELKVMFTFLRIANLFWLLFSAVTVELTLNFNHVHNVLGGGDNGAGGLNLPSQLLPFLVGLFSFIRINYALFKSKWGPDSAKSKESADKDIKGGLLAAFDLPPQNNNSDGDEKNRPPVEEAVVLVSPRSVSFPPEQIIAHNLGRALEEGAPPTPGLPRADSYHIIARSVVVRYLVGFLPWLGIIIHPQTSQSSKISAVVSRGTGLSGVHNTPVVEQLASFPHIKRDSRDMGGRED
ncbi:hypothetical protein B0H63DRAFT_485866 [Podospora didyma]|uniref:Uncharacterized protein n=1 Tax=Podospora didyma TaxID=330526 RepID=A0AAE0N409_9PEZI|nr:hypothetical protein B0H63DRAFT_485866 [Podospora didyma]